jgi:hypothetical protein
MRCRFIRLALPGTSAAAFVQGRGTSILGVTRFQLQQFPVRIKELAEWFGLELARLVVDECLPQRRD